MNGLVGFSINESISFNDVEQELVIIFACQLKSVRADWEIADQVFLDQQLFILCFANLHIWWFAYIMKKSHEGPLGINYH